MLGSRQGPEVTETVVEHRLGMAVGGFEQAVGGRVQTGIAHGSILILAGLGRGPPAHVSEGGS
jgi:hypothetical protein